MTKQKKILPSILFACMLVMTLFCTACTEVAKTSYNTLLLAGHTYDGAMQALADAENQELITTEQYENAKDIAEVYYAAFHSARVALESYVAITDSADSTDAEALLLSTIATMTLRLTELTTYATSIGVAINNLSE